MNFEITNRTEETTEVKQIPIMRTIKQTAEDFGIAAYFVRQLVLSGKVKSIRTGESGRGKILVNQQSLSEYFTNC